MATRHSTFAQVMDQMKVVERERWKLHRLQGRLPLWTDKLIEYNGDKYIVSTDLSGRPYKFDVTKVNED